MFGIWGYVIATVGVFAIVGGAYWYVTSLQHKVEKLSGENIVLKDDNRKLGDSLKDVEHQQQIIVQVDGIGEAERLKIRDTLNRQLKQIDDRKNAGDDKPVGPLLKDFLNGK